MTYPSFSSPAPQSNVPATDKPDTLAMAARTSLASFQAASENVTDPEIEPLNLAKLLMDNENSEDPPPPVASPATCPPNAPGVTGFQLDGVERLPHASEYIDARQQLKPRWMWNPPVVKAKPRRVPQLDNHAGIERELNKLYVDFHHQRVSAADFTKRIYALDTLARVMQFNTRHALAHAKRR